MDADQSYAIPAERNRTRRKSGSRSVRAPVDPLQQLPCQQASPTWIVADGKSVYTVSAVAAVTARTDPGWCEVPTLSSGAAVVRHGTRTPDIDLRVHGLTSSHAGSVRIDSGDSVLRLSVTDQQIRICANERESEAVQIAPELDLSISHGRLEAWLRSDPPTRVFDASSSERLTLAFPKELSMSIRIPKPARRRRSSRRSLLPEAVLERLDETHPNWCLRQTEQATEHALVAWPKPHRNRSTADSPLQILGFLSDGWERRLLSGRWLYSTFGGTSVEASMVEAHGRAGGVVLYVQEHLRPPSSTENTLRSLRAGAVFDGNRSAWCAAQLNAQTALVQLGLAAGTQATAGRLPTPSDALEHMIDEVGSWWHPYLGQYVDVAGAVAEGLSVARFCDEQYQTWALSALDAICDRLEQRDIRSMPVVLQ